MECSIARRSETIFVLADSRTPLHFLSRARIGPQARLARFRSSRPGIRSRAPTARQISPRAGVDRNLRDAYVQQWNLSIQKQIATDILWEVAYRGSKSTRLQTNLNYNEIFPNPPQPPSFVQIFPYPNLAAVSILESRAAGNHHALSTRLEKRYSKGFTFLVNYTFSKTLTDVDASTVGVSLSAGAFGPNTIRNLKDNKGPAIFDRPHQMNVSAVYEPPIFQDRPHARQARCWVDGRWRRSGRHTPGRT